MSYEEKRERLTAYMSECAKQDVILAFSGGVDSSVLLKLACMEAKRCMAAKQCMEAKRHKVYALTIQTTLHPSKEAEEAKKAAEAAGALFLLVKVDELGRAGITDNPVDRCYRCKKYMFTEALEQAKALNVKLVMDGTNADDLLVYRPGIRALKELQITSPLADCEMTKEDVRRLATELEIQAARKPSTPCMATRFPYGTKLNYEELHKAEQVETLVKTLGFYNVRARIHGDLVRLEVDADEIGRLVSYKEKLVPKILAIGYAHVCVDLQGFRSGSQDENLHLTAEDNFRG